MSKSAEMHIFVMLKAKGGTGVKTCGLHIHKDGIFVQYMTKKDHRLRNSEHSPKSCVAYASILTVLASPRRPIHSKASSASCTQTRIESHQWPSPKRKIAPQCAAYYYGIIRSKLFLEERYKINFQTLQLFLKPFETNTMLNN